METSQASDHPATTQEREKMPTTVFLMILGAALAHASWNALIKADEDRLALIKMMFSTQLACSVCLIPFVAVPARESWPYLCASAVLGTGYMLFLNWAYRIGDLSYVYPFARGIAPLIVAVVSVVLLGEHLSHMSGIAVVLIALGAASLALTRGAAGFREPRPVFLSFVAGGFVGAYTITDALGARAAGSPHGYMVWVSLLYALMVAGSFKLLQRRRTTPVLGHRRRNGIVSGLISYGSSWVAIWAFTLAPMALVSALRETSTVFAVIIGVVFLRERLSLTRLASIATTLIGTTVLKLSR
jgi:drug/metabolite transporter (DMT)-like permease